MADIVKAIKRLQRCELYIEEFGDNGLQEWAIFEYNNFLEIRKKYRVDDEKRIIFWLKHNIFNWHFRETERHKVPNSTLEYHIIVYGEIEGPKIYKETSYRKGAKFRDSKTQIENAKKAVIKKKEMGGICDTTNILYWIERKGLSIEDAKIALHDRQATNKIENFIKKYGDIDGPMKWKEKNKNWSDKVNTEETNKKKSLSLKSYIIRYGDEIGTEKYLITRKKLDESIGMYTYGAASKESTKFFKPLLEYLRNNSITYFYGEKDNHEWFIKDKENVKFYFYDLVIPEFKIILEYHGVKFHADIRLTPEERNNWKSLHTNMSFTESLEFDTQKRKIAEIAGWNYYYLFGDQLKEFDNIIDSIKNNYVSLNKHETPPKF